jgi:hypothetical protein
MLNVYSKTVGDREEGFVQKDLNEKMVSSR